MTGVHWRPIPREFGPRATGALPLAGGWAWFDTVAVLERGRPPEIAPAAEAPAEVLERLTAPRPPFAGLTLDRPRLMGILNATPDSFSDGGALDAPNGLPARLDALRGADILDVGGESTRPGAAPVAPSEETRRVLPVITAALGRRTVSIDTRNAATARAALSAGARIVNDISGLTHDPRMAEVAAGAEAVVLMHIQGDPRTMQDAPRYADVLLDVYDALESRIAAAERAGIPRARIAVDPGLGFGKTLEHNLALLRGLSLFHALGCAVLLGASRKGFIGRLAAVERADRRGPGTAATTLHAISQGVQLHRVHDISTVAQAVTLWTAIRREDP